jgi:hypothetical protein
LPALGHGVDGVQHKIDEDLPQRGRLAQDCWDGTLGELDIDRHALEASLILPTGSGKLDDLVSAFVRAGAGLQLLLQTGDSTRIS